jgi:hypothetical protein
MTSFCQVISILDQPQALARRQRDDKRSRDGTSRDAAVPESGPAVDSVRTAREAEAVARKQDTEAELAKASSKKGGEAQVSGESLKRYGDKLHDVTREAGDEPLVKDEPKLMAKGPIHAALCNAAGYGPGAW